LETFAELLDVQIVSDPINNDDKVLDKIIDVGEHQLLEDLSYRELQTKASEYGMKKVVGKNKDKLTLYLSRTQKSKKNTKVTRKRYEQATNLLSKLKKLEQERQPLDVPEIQTSNNLSNEDEKSLTPPEDDDESLPNNIETPQNVSDNVNDKRLKQTMN
jgi:hypothetical protein